MAYNYVYSELNTNGMLMPILGFLLDLILRGSTELSKISGNKYSETQGYILLTRRIITIIQTKCECYINFLRKANNLSQMRVFKIL